jgi:hypothetical protein
MVKCFKKSKKMIFKAISDKKISKVVVSENPKEELYIREGCVRNWSPTKMNVDWQKKVYGNLVRNVGQDGSWFLVVPPYKNLEVALIKIFW